MASRKFYWWHYIPFLLLFLLLSAFYLDPWGGTVLLFLFPPVTLVLASVLVAWAVLVVIRSFKIGGLHKKLIVSLSVLFVLAVIFLVAVRIPAWDCDAEKLAKHYEQKKAENAGFSAGPVPPSGRLCPAG